MIRALRGTRDILPGEVERWQHVERVARTLCERYGYLELRTPVIEREELFVKGTGEATDIVHKEMYSFTDKGGDRVTLRPEATPSMVRAYVEHALEQTLAAAKLYSMGPMFRYERPQKGRYRQFHQLDVEVFGLSDPAIDAEVIDLAWMLVEDLGIRPADLVINSVGCRECRPKFLAALMEALGDDVATLCQDCQRRAKINPLRIYDCKVPADQPIIDRLPHAIDYLCTPCAEHFAGVKAQLDAWAIPWRISHRLVRGLDYYSRTTFEILGAASSEAAEGAEGAAALGAQNALLGGGRYDGLVKDLGGPDRPGIGFAAGLERLVLALPPEAVAPVKPSAFVVAIGAGARVDGLNLLRELRRAGCVAQMDLEGRSLRAQIKRADRVQAHVTLIIGDDELAKGEVTLRNMTSGAQTPVARGAVVDAVRRELTSAPQGARDIS
jgi:histidyl-tRNA synthetase